MTGDSGGFIADAGFLFFSIVRQFCLFFSFSSPAWEDEGDDTGQLQGKKEKILFPFDTKGFFVLTKERKKLINFLLQSHFFELQKKRHKSFFVSF